MAHHHKPKIAADGLIFYVDPLNPKAKDKLTQPDLSFHHDSASILKTGRALDFDGTNDWINVRGTGTNSGSVTYMAWINPDNVGGWDPILSADLSLWWGTNTSGKMYMHHNQTNVASINHTGATTIATNTWTHVAWTWNGSVPQYYINGETDTGSINGAITDTIEGGKISIGGRFENYSGSSDGAYYNGYMSDVRMYKTALAANEIKEIYEKPGLILPGAVSASQVQAIWPLTEGSGSRIYDSTGESAHTGSLQNMAPVWISGSEGGIPLGITGYSDKMYFDGVVDYCEGKASADYAVGTGDFTVGFWMNSGNYGSEGGYYRRIWQINNTGNTAGNIQILQENGDQSLLIWDNAAIIQGSVNVTDDKWHHVMLTRSASIVSLRVDGKLDGQVTWADSISNTGGKCTPLLGVYSLSGGEGNYQGYLDEVFFYNTYLTSSGFEILAASSSANQPLSPNVTTVSSSNLKAYWRNSGNQATGSWNDLSGNSNHMYVGSGISTIIPPSISVTGRDSFGFPLTHKNNGHLEFHSGSVGSIYAGSSIIHDTNNKIDDITQSTVSFWMKQNNHTGDGKGPFFISDSTGKGIFLQSRVDRNYFHMCIETASICPQATSAQTQLSDGDWHAIDITRNGQTVTGYIDGKLIPTSNETGYGSWNMGTSNTTIGGLADNNAVYRYHPGSIATFKIYNRPLSKQEIERNFQMQRNRFGV